MKTKILLPLCIIFCLQLKAQITIEHTYTNLSQSTRPMILYLKNAGTKYYVKASTGFELYNLNHTLYKSISFPPDTFSGNPITQIFEVSENLFDNDSSTIDYFLLRQSSFNTSIFYSKVLDENGNVFFYSDSLEQGQGLGIPLNSAPFDDQKFIIQTDSGAKMILSKRPAIQSYVFSLPGNTYTPCPCTADELHMNISSNITTEKCNLNSYPNPSGNKITVTYRLPSGIHQAELKIISMTGEVVKSYKITDTFSTVEFDNSELPSGNYLYRIILPDGTGDAKTMVVVH